MKDPSKGSWGTKFPWLRLKAGKLTVSATRLDGPGSFDPGLAPADGYPRIGFLPSTPRFSTGGCWRIIGRLGRSTVVLFVKIDGSLTAICADLARQLQTLQVTNNPSNNHLQSVVDAALRAHNCPSVGT